MKETIKPYSVSSLIKNRELDITLVVIRIATELRRALLQDLWSVKDGKQSVAKGGIQ